MGPSAFDMYTIGKSSAPKIVRGPSDFGTNFQSMLEAMTLEWLHSGIVKVDRTTEKELEPTPLFLRPLIQKMLWG